MTTPGAAPQSAPRTIPVPIDTTDAGLGAAEVAARVAAGQVNTAPVRSSRTVWEIVKSNVLTRFNAILGALFVLVMITGSVADGLFGIVLIVNSAIGIVQEYLAKRKLDRLALLNAPTALVIRDGAEQRIPTAEVVLGDLIELRAGDQVPADGTLRSVAGLEVDESNLTGESDPIAKTTDDEVRSGTTVVAGSGRFVAEAVGADSYANRIAAQVREFTRTRSEIQESINKLLGYITWVIVVALPLQLWSQARVVGDQGWREVVIRSAAGLVGLVPEGLVLLTSVAFLMAAVQLTRQQVLVQELPAVEGLARVDVVCVDKTGTLTVGEIAYEDCLPLGDTSTVESEQALGAMADDPNANGTLVAVAAAIRPPAGWRRTDTVAFNSARKWSAASFADRGTWVLGAPDVLLAAGDPIRDQVSTLAATGRRVLLLGRSGTAITDATLPADLRPTALVTLTEQVRPDAAQTLAYFAEQDVTVKVISGDNPTTVAAIATRVGLDGSAAVDARTIGGQPDELTEIASATTVFGRVTPEQKRALVRSLQSQGHVAAMTGDGVNDALALKDADIGIAMGNGAQATKAVAQLVLLDGKFSHLPSVIAEGRRVIGNVERVANLFVAKNAMSLLAIISAAIFALPFPFLPRQLTLVSAVTIGIPAFFLALGPNTRRYTPGFLHRVVSFAVPAGGIAGLAVIVSYLVATAGHGLRGADRVARCTVEAGSSVDPGCASPSTAATITLLTVSFWILIALARPFRLWKALLVGAMVGLAALAFVVPFARNFFDFATTGALVWQSLAIGAAGAAGVELVYRLTYVRHHVRA
jgi:cation-transporting ATPase E